MKALLAYFRFGRGAKKASGVHALLRSVHLHGREKGYITLYPITKKWKNSAKSTQKWVSKKAENNYKRLEQKWKTYVYEWKVCSNP